MEHLDTLGRPCSTGVNPQQYSPLYAKLPVEIRLLIYEFALDSKDDEVDVHSPCFRV